MGRRLPALEDLGLIGPPASPFCPFTVEAGGAGRLPSSYVAKTLWS